MEKPKMGFDIKLSLNELSIRNKNMLFQINIHLIAHGYS